MKYTARVINEIDNGKNYWKYLNVGVFKIENDVEEQIGEYKRNYSSLFNTFFHLQRNGKDFALYSPHYTATRIMELPSCQDIGGEEPGAGGFCPTDYFVPTFIEQETSWETINQACEKIGGKASKHRVNNPDENDLNESVESREFVHQTSEELCQITTVKRPLTSLNYYHFGFIAGCLWGDDSSWKIQYLDLSEAERGTIRREERFGYVELLEKITLQEAVRISGYNDESGKYKIHIRVKTMQTFDLTSGKIVDPFG